jgi:hypothetical protein
MSQIAGGSRTLSLLVPANAVQIRPGARPKLYPTAPRAFERYVDAKIAGLAKLVTPRSRTNHTYARAFIELPGQLYPESEIRLHGW